MKYSIIFFLIFLSFSVFAQFTDDFSDGDFNNSPEWIGETSKFQVNASNELQLYDATESGTAYLSTESQAINDATWEFLVRFDFNPSSSNYANVFLCSDKSDLSGNLNGYFIKIGNTEDEVSLYRRDNGSDSEIIDGTDNLIDMNDVEVRVKVTRDASGNWELFSDSTGGSAFTSEGTVQDTTHKMSFYFGVNCIFTSTRWYKFYFDDFIVTGDAFVDEQNPELLSVSVEDNQHLKLSFSEPMDSATSLNTSNYTVNNGIGSPVSAIFDGGNSSLVVLEFSNSFQPNQSYRISYQNMEDLFGNTITTGFYDFSNVVINENDIVFSELMPDPTPAQGLPEQEYAEIYNKRDLPVNLEGWKLIIGSTMYDFPSVTIPANDYLIICDSDSESEFTSFGNTAAFPFANYYLSNSGESLQLFNDDALLINTVSYTEDWYQDPTKDDGGWSLEIIDPLNNCGGMTNWRASVSPNGGTPGTANSVDAPNQDSLAPEINSWELAASNEIKIHFSEVTDPNTSLITSNYNVSPGLGEPVLVSLDENDPRVIRLQYAVSFQEATEYTLSVSNISDECGNIMQDSEIEFVVYTGETFDVLITEIMPDPSPVVYLPEAEYIELHNKSIYTINISGWTLYAGDTDCELPAAEIAPHEYLALCDEEDVDLFPETMNIIGVSSMPSLTNDYGNLKIYNKDNDLIHFVNYLYEWYGNSSKSDGGWSLEMIDTDNPCGESDNWKASNSSTGGTPGRANSVAGENPDIYIPELQNAIITEPDTLTVYFNEALHPDFIPDVSKFSVDNSIGNPANIYFLSGHNNALKMVFSQSFQIDVIYRLIITDTVIDCAGNSLSETVSIDFAIPDTAEKSDIVINEILFNPRDGGFDFVELYNNSEKIIDLADLRMASRDDSMMIDNLSIIIEAGFLLFPGEFCVISENTTNINNYYYCKNPDQLLQIENLPSYSNSEGDVILCKPNQDIIDEVVYNEDMHFSLLRSVDGVSLERIDYNKESVADNWHSAAEDVGFATPTYENSQYMSIETATGKFELSPESFSPDNDGYDDVLNISYKMNKQGYVLSIYVFDASGHPVKSIIENELLGTSGNFTWDGLNENGEHPGSGIYIVLFEYYDLEGNVHKEKKTTVISVKR